ncbi:MAG TPA: hypothetical protein EYP41_10270 [Anaerolineae bacterium]|nr:hypothetical protein [Anaerolineae bacterium]HIP72174.1 hypothetical protein [Anaerolineae bacterium]
MDIITESFAACGRCSYFWAGYRVIHGLEDQERVAAQTDPDWLILTWSYPMGELLLKSYGSRFDIDFAYYEGCCKECRRHFVYDAIAENQTPTLKMQRVPRLKAVSSAGPPQKE